MSQNNLNLFPASEYDPAHAQNGLQLLNPRFNDKWLINRKNLRDHFLARGNFLLRQWIAQPGVEYPYEDTIHRAIYEESLVTLHQVKHLPGFPFVQHALEKYDTVGSACHEAFMAKVWLNGGYEVEFIPRREGVRTPDVHARKGDVKTFTECKRKERLLQPAPIRIRGVDILERVGANTPALPGEPLGVGLVICGEFQEAMIDALRDMVQRLRGTSQRFAYDKKASCGVVLFDCEPPEVDIVRSSFPGPDGIMVHNETMMFAPMLQGIAAQSMSYRFEPAEDGTRRPVYNRVALLDIFDTHRIASIINSFNDACGQLPPDELGFVAIDVDLKYLHPDRQLPYLQFMGEVIGTMFTAEQNTRVAGVLLTADKIRVYRPNKDDAGNELDQSKFVYKASKSASLVTNDFKTMPADFCFPGFEGAETVNAITESAWTGGNVTPAISGVIPEIPS